MPTASLDARIISTPDIMGGKPRIAGHRITVRDVVMWYEYQGQSADEIAEQKKKGNGLKSFARLSLQN